MVSKRERPDFVSNREVLPNPVSTTILMPSIVRLVSAMEVASTIFRRPFLSGNKAARCALMGS